MAVNLAICSSADHLGAEFGAVAVLVALRHRLADRRAES